MAGPVLEGVRVLDVGRYLAGPYCAGLLAQLGADVVRVEPPEGGEDRWLVPLGEGRPGGVFLQANRAKRGITLDLSTAAGRAVMRRLADRADIVVANLSPPALRFLGLDYAALRAGNPDVILVAVSAFGASGPEADRVGFDAMAQALCGAMHLSGFPGRPAKAYVPWVDYATALAAALGALAALAVRGRTGQGQEVQASLLATGLTVAASPLAEQAVLGKDRHGTGNRAQTYGPSDVFSTLDGAVCVQVIGRPLFERCARLLGEPGWLADPRLATDEGRGRHADLLCARLALWCAGRTTAECLAALAEARLPAAPVLTPRQCLDHPQVRAVAALEPTAYPGFPMPFPLPGLPMRLQAGAGPAGRRAPTLGEHTDEVLAELGYDARAIGELRAEGVV